MVVVMPIIGSWDEDRGVVKYNRSQDRPAWGGGLEVDMFPFDAWVWNRSPLDARRAYVDLGRNLHRCAWRSNLISRQAPVGPFHPFQLHWRTS